MSLASASTSQYPVCGGVRHAYGSRVWGNTPGVFALTRCHRHPNGAHSGRIWESGAGKCLDSGSSEGLAMVWDGFERVERGVEIEVNGKRW